MTAQREAVHFKHMLEVLRTIIGPSVLTQATGLAIAFAAQIVMARAIGAAEFGIFSFWLAVASSASIVGRFGWDSTILRFGKGLSPGGRPRLMCLATSRVWRNSAIASVVVLAAGALVALTQGSTVSYLVIGTCAALIPLFAQSGLYQSFLIVEGNIWRALAPEYILRPSLLLIGGFMLLALQARSALLALLVAVAATGASLLTGQLLARRVLKSRDSLSHVDEEHQDEWIANSRATMYFNGAYQLLAYSDILIAGVVLSPSELGYYAAARALATLATLALVSMQVPIGPRIAVALRSGDLSHARGLIALVTRLSALFAGAVFIVAITAGSSLLSAFGPGFQSAYGTLSVFALAQLLNVSAGPLGSVVTMSGLQRSAAQVYLVATAALILLSIMCAPAMGATGIALAYLVATVIWTVAINARLRRDLGISTWLLARDARPNTV